MPTLTTTWRSLSRGTRGCLTLLLGSFLLLGLTYTGYCWGWWGRTNLTLQYLFQCQCPPASEAVRYRPYIILASACTNPDLVSIASDGRYVVLEEQRPHPRTLLVDLMDGQRRDLNLDPQAVGHSYIVDAHLLLVSLPMESGFFLLDLRDDTRTTIPFSNTAQLDTSLFTRFRQAERVVSLGTRESNFILALAPNYRQHPDQNVVLPLSGLRDLVHAQLDAAQIPYTLYPPPYAEDPVPYWKRSRDQRFYLDNDGIYLSATRTRIVTLHLPIQGDGRNGYYAYGWRADNRAVVYNLTTPYVFDLSAFYFGWAFLPVPQPILLVEVPAAYWE